MGIVRSRQKSTHYTIHAKLIIALLEKVGKKRNLIEEINQNLNEGIVNPIISSLPKRNLTFGLVLLVSTRKTELKRNQE